MNEEMLLRLICENTAAQDRVCDALMNVGTLLEKVAESNEGLADAVTKMLDQLENNNKDRFRLPPALGSG